MPWPPVIPTNTRTNDTPTRDAHPSDHNALASALTDVVARIGPGVSSELAYVEQTAAQSNIQTTTVDLTGLVITFTLATPRRVLLYGSAWYSKSAPDTAGGVFASIWSGTTGGAEVQGRGGYCAAPGQFGVEVRRRVLLAAGTFSYRMRGSTAAGFLNTISSTAEPSILGAIDLGPQ